MHTNDILTGQRLCACVEIETIFMNDQFTCLNRLEQAPQAKTTCARERVSFSDTYASGAHWGTPRMPALETKMSLFQPNCHMEFFISRCFSATVYQTGPLRV